MKAGVTSLKFVETFCIAKEDMMKLIDSGQFPFMQVLCKHCTVHVHITGTVTAPVL